MLYLLSTRIDGETMTGLAQVALLVVIAVAAQASSLDDRFLGLAIRTKFHCFLSIH
jgi:hypothetical protein